jgi:putative two-component system response regulator
VRKPRQNNSPQISIREANLLNHFNEDKAAGRLAEIVALECGASPAEAGRIRVASSLHDIGKQKISGSILNKPGKLTSEEFDEMKLHTKYGAEMLAGIQGELGETARAVALWHHEHYSGKGYWGKFLYELPYYVGFAAIADVFTALVCIRPYKKAFPHEDALAYIQNQSGTQFNPLLVDVFIPLVRNDRRVRAIFEEAV